MKKLILSLVFTLTTSATFSAGISQKQTSSQRFTISSIAESAFVHHFTGESAGKSSFYLPCVAIAMTYEFGRQWTLSGEMELAQTPCFQYEEPDLNIVLSEFFIGKSFNPYLNIKAGYLLQPLGHLGLRDEPLDFFTVNPPYNETALVPFCLKETGLSLHGNVENFYYEGMISSGLSAYTLRGEYDFSPDHGNTFIPNIVAGLSAHHRKNLCLTAFDFHVHQKDWILRGNALFRHIWKNPPKSETTAIDAENALGLGIEAGYNMLPLFRNADNQSKLYLFTRYDHSHSSDISRSDIALGINYMPHDCLVMKAQYLCQNPQRKSELRHSEISLSLAFIGDLFSR